MATNEKLTTNIEGHEMTFTYHNGDTRVQGICKTHGVRIAQSPVARRNLDKFITRHIAQYASKVVPTDALRSLSVSRHIAQYASKVPTDAQRAESVAKHMPLTALVEGRKPQPLSETAKRNYSDLAKTAPTQTARDYWTRKAEGK